MDENQLPSGSISCLECSLSSFLMFSKGTLQVKSSLDVTILVQGEMILFTGGGTVLLNEYWLSDLLKKFLKTTLCYRAGMVEQPLV